MTAKCRDSRPRFLVNVGHNTLPFGREVCGQPVCDPAVTACYEHVAKSTLLLLAQMRGEEIRKLKRGLKKKGSAPPCICGLPVAEEYDTGESIVCDYHHGNSPVGDPQ